MLRQFFSSWMLTALRQDQINSFKKQYKLTDKQILLCNQADPSPKDTYTGWLCKIFAQTSGEEEQKAEAVKKLTSPLMQFMKLVNSPDFPKDKKDIGKYTAQELLNLVGNQRRYLKNLSPKAIEKLVKSEGLPGAKIVWDGGGFRMWYVTNADYAMILGSNTGWCTAANKNYAETYTLRGGLYITYLHGKPFMQGHYSDRDFAFLNVRDVPPDLLDPQVIGMLTTIQHPIIEVFKRVCDGRFDNYLNNLDSNKLESKANEIRTYAENSDSIAVITAACKKVWWEEGWQVLMDSPIFLLRALEGARDSIKQALKKSDMAQDIGEICLDKNATELALFFGDESLVREYVVQVLDGSKLPSRFRDDSLMDLVDRLAVEQIEKRVEPPKMDADYLEYFGSDTTFAYWKKFVNRPWRVKENILRKYPEYKAREEELRPIMKLLKLAEGDTVEPGPDCPQKFKKGVVTEIKGNEVQVNTNEGQLLTFIQNEQRGIYQLQLIASETKIPIRYSPMVITDFKSFRMKPGMKLLPGVSYADRKFMGNVVEVSGDRCVIEWYDEHGNDDGRDDFYWPDASLFIVAVPYNDPLAFSNWESVKSDASPFQVGDIVTLADSSKADDYEYLNGTAGVVMRVDEGDVEVKKINGDSQWYPPSAIVRLKPKAKTWHEMKPQPRELKVGMSVIKGPDWTYGEQDVTGLTDKEIEEMGNKSVGEVVTVHADWPEFNVSVQWANHFNNYTYVDDHKDLTVVEFY